MTDYGALFRAVVFSMRRTDHGPYNRCDRHRVAPEYHDSNHSVTDYVRFQVHLSFVIRNECHVHYVCQILK